MITKRTLNKIQKIQKRGDIKTISEVTGFSRSKVSCAIRNGNGEAEYAVEAFYTPRIENLKRSK